MMSRILALLGAALFAAGIGPAVAFTGSDLRMEETPINRLDAESLQRGARTFVNYCLNCHSAKYMRYNRLTDIGVDIPMIEDNLMFATKKVGETMMVAMTAADAKAWFGTPPPDLTVESRVRGAAWLYNYFLGFYRDDATVTGWNNLVFPNVAMPHVLWELSGTNRLVTTEFKSHEEAQGYALAAKGLVLLAPGKNDTFIVETLMPEMPGTLSPIEYRAMVADLVNYLDYMAEPNKNSRIRLGLAVLLYIGLLFFFAFWLKREYWKDIH